MKEFLLIFTIWVGFDLAYGTTPDKAAAPNPFDPEGYLDAKGTGDESKTKKSVEPTAKELTGMGVFRISGRRFVRYDSSEGSVYIECPANIPDFVTAMVLCPQHVKQLPEVIKIRDAMPVDETTRKIAKDVLARIADCNS